MASNSKIIKIFVLLFVAELLLALILFNYIFNKNNEEGEIYEMSLVLNNGLIFIEGETNPFTGRIQGTLSTNLVLEFNVVNGVKNGQYLLFNAQGKLVVSGWTENNKNSGTWEYYYDDGQLRCTGDYKDDEQSGKWIWYQSNGLKECEGSFLNGSMHGKFIKYDDKGDLRLVINYESGRVISFVEIYQPKII